MNWTGHPEPDSRPVVDWLAGQIHDPVAKLRFLKVAAAHRRPSGRRPRRRYALAAVPIVLSTVFLARPKARVEVQPPRAAAVAVQPSRQPAEEPPRIWLVEKNSDIEVYSNGLRVETRYEVATHPRRYIAFEAGRPRQATGELRTAPAGIVFHATESRQAPFEEGQNGVLKRLGESLLDYVRRKAAYNFVIDRFGRVYRVVRESDAANHAGYSVWADEQSEYINLNESFLGVSFEAAETAEDNTAISPAQERAAAVLVEMLRSRYGIPASNCITHAQVSVNPNNMRVGYHTDWASGFPFESVGLPNNYDEPLRAIADFGFECDTAFLEHAGKRLKKGVEIAEDLLRQSATGRGLKAHAYRLQLHEEYREKLAIARHATAATTPPAAELARAIK